MMNHRTIILKKAASWLQATFFNLLNFVSTNKNILLQPSGCIESILTIDHKNKYEVIGLHIFTFSLTAKNVILQ